MAPCRFPLWEIPWNPFGNIFYLYLFIFYIHNIVHNVLLFYSVESGRIQAQIDITLKDPFQSCCVVLTGIYICLFIIHKIQNISKHYLIFIHFYADNVNLVGAYNKHLLKWERHGLTHMFLETGLSIKLVQSKLLIYDSTIFFISLYNFIYTTGFHLSLMETLVPSPGTILQQRPPKEPPI